MPVTKGTNAFMSSIANVGNPSHVIVPAQSQHVQTSLEYELIDDELGESVVMPYAKPPHIGADSHTHDLSVPSSQVLSCDASLTRRANPVGMSVSPSIIIEELDDAVEERCNNQHPGMVEHKQHWFDFEQLERSMLPERETCKHHGGGTNALRTYFPHGSGAGDQRPTSQEPTLVAIISHAVDHIYIHRSAGVPGDRCEPGEDAQSEWHRTAHGDQEGDDDEHARHAELSGSSNIEEPEHVSVDHDVEKGFNDSGEGGNKWRSIFDIAGNFEHELQSPWEVLMQRDQHAQSKDIFQSPGEVSNKRDQHAHSEDIVQSPGEVLVRRDQHAHSKNIFQSPGEEPKKFSRRRKAQLKWETKRSSTNSQMQVAQGLADASTCLVSPQLQCVQRGCAW